MANPLNLFFSLLSCFHLVSCETEHSSDAFNSFTTIPISTTISSSDTHMDVTSSASKFRISTDSSSSCLTQSSIDTYLEFIGCKKEKIYRRKSKKVCGMFQDMSKYMVAKQVSESGGMIKHTF